MSEKLEHPGFELKWRFITKSEATEIQIARRLGISLSTLVKIMAGREDITSDLSMAIGIMFDIDSDYFLDKQTKYDAVKQKLLIPSEVLADWVATAGVTISDIADSTQLPEATVEELLNGTEMTYDESEELGIYFGEPYDALWNIQLKWKAVKDDYHEKLKTTVYDKAQDCETERWVGHDPNYVPDCAEDMEIDADEKLQKELEEVIDIGDQREINADEEEVLKAIQAKYNTTQPYRLGKLYVELGQMLMNPDTSLDHLVQWCHEMNLGIDVIVGTKK